MNTQILVLQLIYLQYLYSSQIVTTRSSSHVRARVRGGSLLILSDFFTWMHRMGNYRLLQTPKQGGNLATVVKKLGSIDRKVREVRVQRDREPGDRSCAVSARICLEAASHPRTRLAIGLTCRTAPVPETTDSAPILLIFLLRRSTFFKSSQLFLMGLICIWSPQHSLQGSPHLGLGMK